MNLDKNQTVQNALQHDDLDAACRVIQDAVGQKDGGLAAIFFSHLEEDGWKQLDQDEREDMLKEYLELELSYVEVK